VYMVCQGINMRNPVLIPAVIPPPETAELKQIADIAGKYSEIPSNLKALIPHIFSTILIPDSGIIDGIQTGVVLRRVGKTVEKEELFTQLQNGKKIKIFHTCLSVDEPKPYSAKEMARLKIDGLARMFKF
jgi:hypothetical protein